jgi:hypothetical protein
MCRHHHRRRRCRRRRRILIGSRVYSSGMPQPVIPCPPQCRCKAVTSLRGCSLWLDRCVLGDFLPPHYLPVHDFRIYTKHCMPHQVIHRLLRPRRLWLQVQSRLCVAAAVAGQMRARGFPPTALPPAGPVAGVGHCRSDGGGQGDAPLPGFEKTGAQGHRPAQRGQVMTLEAVIVIIIIITIITITISLRLVYASRGPHIMLD